ncbi:hypothetical protein E4U10_008176, partial [Claviceps purpurea]
MSRRSLLPLTIESPHHPAHGPPEADTGNAHVTIASVTTTVDYTASMGLPCYHKIMSILESGD